MLAAGDLHAELVLELELVLVGMLEHTSYPSTHPGSTEARTRTPDLPFSSLPKLVYPNTGLCANLQGCRGLDGRVEHTLERKVKRKGQSQTREQGKEQVNLGSGPTDKIVLFLSCSLAHYALSRMHAYASLTSERRCVLLLLWSRLRVSVKSLMSRL